MAFVTFHANELQENIILKCESVCALSEADHVSW